MSVKPATYNFPAHKRGTTFDAQKLVLNGVNLTGATIIMQFKELNNSKVIYEFKTVDGSILLTNPAVGEFELQERILDVPKCTYYYDCLIILASEEKKVYFEGSQIITNRISG
jgi:hypothetical protein